MAQLKISPESAIELPSQFTQIHGGAPLQRQTKQLPVHQPRPHSSTELVIVGNTDAGDTPCRSMESEMELYGIALPGWTKPDCLICPTPPPDSGHATEKRNVQRVALAQAEEPRQCKTLGWIGTVGRDVADVDGEFLRRTRRSASGACESGKRRVGRGSAEGQEAGDGAAREVEAGIPLHGGTDQQINPAERVLGLLEQKLHETIGDPDRRRDIERVRRVFRRIGDDDAIGAGGTRGGDRNVGGETAVDEIDPIAQLRLEEQGHRGARANRLRQIAGIEDDGGSVSETGGHGPEWNRQRVEIAAGEQIPPKHSGVEQRARLALDDRRTLDSEASVALFPDDQRLQDAKRAGSERLIRPEKVGKGNHSGQ